MTRPPVIQGWCPGALRPMLSGDGLVVRVRPRGGRLSPVQALRIADLAARFGNGLIDLSARANVQVRGVSAATHAALIDGLAGVGLLDDSAGTEAARNIVVAPFWETGDGTQDLAERLMRALAQPDAPCLPGKFGYAVDTGFVPVLRAVSADIRLERLAGQLIVRADGAATAAGVTPETAVAAAMELAAWFLGSGGVSNGRGRMAALMARGARLPERFEQVAVRTGGALPPPRPGLGPQGAMVGFDFGQMTAATLAALAALGPLRVTPWRMLLIEGAVELPDIAGVIIRGDDPMLRVIACTGAPACVQAHQPTRILARAVAQFVPQDAELHVAGCAKGCAHPSAARLTLVATQDGFDLIRDGTAADVPARRGLRADALAAHPDLMTEFAR